MLSLDLFNSKYEKPLQEGAVCSVTEQTPNEPAQSKYVANFNEFNTPENIAVVRDIWTRIQAHFIDEDLTWQWLTLKWPNHAEAVTLSPNQVFSILKKISTMSPAKQKVTLLTNFGNRNSFLSWLSGVKVTPRPLPKKDVPKGQQSLDLKEFKQSQKKNSNELTGHTAKDVQVARELQKLRAMYPSANSDIEALVKDDFATKEKTEKTISNLKNVNRRQDDLLKQISTVNQQQQVDIEDLDSEERTLQQTVAQLRQANANLADKLLTMRQRRDTTTPAVTTPLEPELGVSVATDKVPSTIEPTTIEPTTPPSRDERLRRYAQKLRQQIRNLELKTTLQSPEGQDELRQKIDTLEKQLDQIQTATPVSKDAAVGGKQADVLPSAKAKAKRSTAISGDNDIAISSTVADMLKDISASSKKKSKKQSSTSELQPVPIEEALPAKAAKELYRWMNQQNQPQQEPVATTTPVEPQPQPARLSDLQARHQKVEALFNLKKKIEIEKDKATAGGRILPRGLAADLEDYYSMDDIDTHYDQMLAAYQKQLKAIEQYRGMKKILNKKVTHEMRANELQETKESPAWEQGGREGYYHRPNKNPYKPGTQEHSDYNRGYEHFKGDKDWDVPKRRSVPEDTKSEFKAAALNKIKKALSNPKLDPSVRKDYEARLKKIQDLEEAKWKKETPWVKSTGKDPRGEVTHMSDVARKETERREREDGPMGQLFKDFEKVFGKKPPVKEGDAININRGGYNQFRDKNDFLDKRDYVQKQLLDPRQRDNHAELKQRLQDINYAGRKLGYIK